MEQKDLYRGGTPQPTFLATPQIPWTELGTITVQQAYPAVGARSHTSVAALAAANRVLWSIPNPVTGLMLRFQTTANANAHVLALLGFAGTKGLDASGAWQDDHALYLGQLTLTGGQQVGPHSNVFVDTIVAANGLWAMTAFDSGNDRIAVVSCDAKGIKELFLVATTLQGSTTLYVEGRTY